MAQPAKVAMPVIATAVPDHNLHQWANAPTTGIPARPKPYILAVGGVLTITAYREEIPPDNARNVTVDTHIDPQWHVYNG